MRARLPDRGEPFFEIVYDIIDVFAADGEADGGGGNARAFERCLVHLGVCRRCRMNDEGFDVGNVGELREEVERIDESACLRTAAMECKREDGDAAMREVLLIERVVGVCRKRWMVDRLYGRVCLQEVNDLQRVLGVTLHAKGERLDALQEQKCIKRTQRRARIAQEQGADVDGKRCSADILGKG